MQSGGLWAPGSGVEAGMGATAAPPPLRRLPIFITVNKICLKGHCVTSHLFRYNQSLPLLSSYRARVAFFHTVIELVEYVSFSFYRL